MGRGVSSGGGQSSLGYLFGSGEAPKPAPNTNRASPKVEQAPAPAPVAAEPVQAAAPAEGTQQIPAGIAVSGSKTNNYFRADGQNTGNFLTDRPSTKVHAAPGGGSSLGYLFGDAKK
ncbi:unnamed protein product [Linum tenue]|uniref:Uncharacterized protein n=2 Tax=Linum TaxID=4005 RepID=A0AAV0RS29_9ROSI|nr:unnamed protein product [Linum tenue]